MAHSKIRLPGKLCMVTSQAEATPITPASTATPTSRISVLTM